MTTSLDLAQRNQLRTTAQVLNREFKGVFATEVIERFLHESLDQLLRGANYTNFVPVLAERFARERLRALGKIQGDIVTDTPTVIFLCVHNAGRSQMAMGWMQHLAGDRIEVMSGGSDPGSQVNPSAVAAMDEVGIDISSGYPKPWTDETIGAADVIVTMGCGDACPVLPGKRYLDWELEDPAGKGVAEVRPVRDDIERRVRGLMRELGVEPPA
ncbi:arsenate reductase ArsC [Salsipaludibacter albus]|uniref:arsenate reductase ArsC n=1 Tax=Salsipaludibacter albus TaxID=2849650 RepID=UPI001EE3B244|nr:arsenate reductase ArsC [Salsipaludibacter albus]MBY5162370.1 arsenate reductase ArsC [Salsipaludibacter albus]